MLNYHDLKTDLHGTLLRLWQFVDVAADPLTWAWIARALSREDVANNSSLRQMLDQGRRWLASDAAWDDACLAGAMLLCAVLRGMGGDPCIDRLPHIVARMRYLCDHSRHKFSRLNDPNYTYGLASGTAGQLPHDLRDDLRDFCARHIRSHNWQRALLFAASLDALGGPVTPIALDVGTLRIDGLPVALWFVERYGHLVDGAERQRAVWEAFERSSAEFRWDATANGDTALYPASPIDAAMVYDALLSRIEGFDPLTLFDNFPWHPAIRTAARGPFSKGEYVMAVFQAGVTFVDAVKQRAHHPTNSKGQPLDGVQLMQHVFEGKQPPLKFNALRTQADTYSGPRNLDSKAGLKT